MKNSHRLKIKDNSRKTGWAQDRKNKKRLEAEERNKKYPPNAERAIPTGDLNSVFLAATEGSKDFVLASSANTSSALKSLCSNSPDSSIIQK